jgi:hypothetical protein
MDELTSPLSMLLRHNTGDAHRTAKLRPPKNQTRLDPKGLVAVPNRAWKIRPPRHIGPPVVLRSTGLKASL